jgi:hypothetical protein
MESGLECVTFWSNVNTTVATSSFLETCYGSLRMSVGAIVSQMYYLQLTYTYRCGQIYWHYCMIHFLLKSVNFCFVYMCVWLTTA